MDIHHITAGATTQMEQLGKRLHGEDQEVAKSGLVVEDPVPKKRRKSARTKAENFDEKARKYSVLSAFFRLYIAQDAGSAVLKEAIFNLYTLQVPASLQVARNAVFRHMWSTYGKGISKHQSQYRDYIRGLKMRTSEEQCTYPRFQDDKRILMEHGVDSLFSFNEESLALPAGGRAAAEPNGATHSPASGDQAVLRRLDDLQDLATSLVAGIEELRRVVVQRADET
mmetsp:Transcript_8920/g.36838  ORF Transcript_8920/g.36838 Transcript_8920/m.36838 type:complete len:226 (+) Transcript_8920:160-837(+)